LLKNASSSARPRLPSSSDIRPSCGWCGI
jgi:hypothetical protein